MSLCDDVLIKPACRRSQHDSIISDHQNGRVRNEQRFALRLTGYMLRLHDERVRGRVRRRRWGCYYLGYDAKCFSVCENDRLSREIARNRADARMVHVHDRTLRDA